MLNYIILSFCAAVSFGISTIFNKLTSKHAIQDNLTFLFYYFLTFIPFSVLIPFVSNIQIPSNAWLPLFSYSIFFLLASICFFAAMSKIDASVIAPFFQVQSIFIAIFAFLFLGERFPVTNYIWFVLMLFGAILVSLDEKMSLKSFLNKTIFLVILAQFFYALANISSGFALKEVDSWNFVFWSNLISGVFPLIIVIFLPKNRLKVSFHKLKSLLIANLFAFIGVVSLFSAFQTNLTISSAISLLTSPFVFLISIVLSKFKPEFLETHSLKVYLIRGLGIIVILFSAIKISLATT